MCSVARTRIDLEPFWNVIELSCRDATQLWCRRNRLRSQLPIPTTMTPKLPMTAMQKTTLESTNQWPCMPRRCIICIQRVVARWRCVTMKCGGTAEASTAAACISFSYERRLYGCGARQAGRNKNPKWNKNKNELCTHTHRHASYWMATQDV